MEFAPVLLQTWAPFYLVALQGLPSALFLAWPFSSGGVSPDGFTTVSKT